MRMLVLASLVVAGGANAAEAAVGSLATHRAVYDLKLKDASQRSGIEGMVGRMVYEFNGSACDGYTVSFRFVTEINSGEGSRVTDQQTTTFEDVRRGTFNFVTRSFVNQTLDKEVRGAAALKDDALAVELEEPEKQDIEIGKALFPTEHMIELINHAKKGEQFYESRIFDGSDGGDEAMITTTILGEVQKADTGDTEAKAAGALADKDFWPVSISYFEDVAEGDGLPVYTIAFKLYENGVTRDLTMDYGDFVLEGTLAQLDMFEPTDCNE